MDDCTTLELVQDTTVICVLMREMPQTDTHANGFVIIQDTNSKYKRIM